VGEVCAGRCGSVSGGVRRMSEVFGWLGTHRNASTGVRVLDIIIRWSVGAMLVDEIRL
jgi:hypothetical protein